MNVLNVTGAGDVFVSELGYVYMNHKFVNEDLNLIN